MATIPPGKRPAVDPVCHTPRSRRRACRDNMPVTPLTMPSRTSYVPSPRADALDALAAVACTTSPSTSLLPSPLNPHVHSPSLLPQAAVHASAATAAATSTWLTRLVQSRPETADRSPPAGDHSSSDGDVNNCPAAVPPTTEALRAVVPRAADWASIVRGARRAVDRISHLPGSVSDPEQYACSATAVYYAALEGLLRDESERLRGDHSKLAQKLVRNHVFHDSVMAFSWECAVAAAGRLDMRMLWMAMHNLRLSPFALTKVVEAFVKRFRDMPLPLRLHLMNCDARIVERRLWIPGSELVAVLSRRAHGDKWGTKADSPPNSEQKNALSSTYPSNKDPHPAVEQKSTGKTTPGKGDENEKIVGNTDANDKGDADVNTNVETDSLTSKDVVLHMVYSKVLGLAARRAQELLLLLGLDDLANDVWRCFKACIWQHWYIMVSRHLDQVIMCCIYGVAKVHRLDVKFRDIVILYRTMRHVRDPSFTPLLPDVIRRVSLTSHANLVQPTSALTPLADDQPMAKWGDLIQLYNEIFIPSMKKLLLGLGPASKKLSSSSSLCNTQHGSTNSTGANEQNNSCEKGNTDKCSADRNSDGGAAAPPPTSKDALRDAVLRSPLRTIKRTDTVKRIGRVTIGSMSPRDSGLAALRAQQSPVPRHPHPVMTPATRTLYAFGESPGVFAMRSGDVVNRESHRHLSLDSANMSDKTAVTNLRKRIADAFAGKNGRARHGAGGKEDSPTSQHQHQQQQQQAEEERAGERQES